MRGVLTVFLFWTTLVVIQAVYQASPRYTAPQQFADAKKKTSRYPFVLSTGSKISKIILFPYDSGTITNFDALPVLLQVCQTQLQSNGSYLGGTENCTTVPKNSYINPASKRTLVLDADEFLSSVYLYGGDYLPYWLNHIEFRTTKGQTVSSGGSYYYSPAYYSQYGYTIKEANFTVPYGYQLAGINYGVYGKEAMTEIQFSTDKVTTCGDGVIDLNEDCDVDSPCCLNCKFAPATHICRPSAGLCDVPENCTSTSASCPDDSYRPYGSPCGEFFGMCDVQLEKSCPGTSSQCFPTPNLPANLIGVSPWSSFHVLAFDTFSCDGGNVDGRLAARNSIRVSDFTLGSGLRFASDGMAMFSMYTSGNVTWTSGSLLPDGTDSLPAMGFFGENSNAPDYLTSRFTNLTDGDVASSFDEAQNYFNLVQLELAGLSLNVEAVLVHGDGLMLTCQSRQPLYHVSIDAKTFNSINWYSPQGCQFGARWIIDITGTDAVNFQGQPFPGIVERVIYNILGSGRTITANNGINGHILAPKNNFQQDVGIVYGQMVVKNVNSKAIHKPNCQAFNPAQIAVKLVRPVNLGDSVIYVADLGNLVLGDLLCISGDCNSIVSGEYRYGDSIGLIGTVRVASAFQVSVLAGEYATVTVANSTGADRDTPLAVRPTDPDLFASTNGAEINVVMGCSMFVAMLSLLL